MENCKVKYQSLKTRKYHATRTINDVKEVADDRVSVARDLKMDLVIAVGLPQRDDHLMQVSAIAEETSRLSDL